MDGISCFVRRICKLPKHISQASPEVLMTTSKPLRSRMRRQVSRPVLKPSGGGDPVPYVNPDLPSGNLHLKTRPPSKGPDLFFPKTPFNPGDYTPKHVF